MRNVLSSLSSAHAAVLSLVTFLLPPVGLLVPKGTVVLLLVAALATAAALWKRDRRLPSPSGATLCLFALLLVWAASASFWSFDPAGGLKLTARLAPLAIAGLWLTAMTKAFDAAARERAARALLLGVALTVLLILVELLLDFPLARYVRGVSDLPGYYLSSLNRGATALALLIWPATAVAWRRGYGWRALAIPAALVALFLFLTSSAALAGILAGLATALLALLHRKAGRLLVLAAAAGALFLGPLVGPTLYRHGAMDWDWLNSTAKHRVHIWNFASERIAERPLFGWGFNSSRDMPNFGVEPYDNRTRVIPLHPHNGALQVFLELGLAGALLIFGILWLVAARLERLALPDRIAGQAACVSGIAIACTAYGLWQSQWLALLFLFAAVVSLVAAPAGVDVSEQRP